MAHIFSGLRISRQCLRNTVRAYSYKPVERKTSKEAASKLTDLVCEMMREGRVRYPKDMVRSRKADHDEGRSLKIIESLPPDPNMLGAKDVLDVFEKLSAGPISDEAFLHSNFYTLVESTKLVLSQLNATENVKILRCISRSKIPMFDELTETVAQGLMNRISVMTVNDIIEIDFSIRGLITETKISKLLETLRQVTRAAFVAKVNVDLLESQEYEKLIRIMCYLSNNSSLVQNIDHRLLKQLLEKDDHKFKIDDVTCVIVMLLRFPHLNQHGKELLTKIFPIWCDNAKNVGDAKKILDLLFDNCWRVEDLGPFHNPSFIQHCTELAKQCNDTKKKFEVLKQFNRMKFVSIELIDHLSKHFDDTSYKQFKTAEYELLFTACLLANHKPSNWTSKMVPAIKNVELNDTTHATSLEMAERLIKLGIYHNQIMEHVVTSHDITSNSPSINDKYYLILRAYKQQNRKYKSDKNENKKETSNHVQNTTASWLTKDLDTFIGTNKVLHDVSLSEDVKIPLVLKVNVKTGNFIDMLPKDPMEKNLHCNENEVIIGVITQDIGKKTNELDSIIESIEEQRRLIKQNGWLAIVLDKSLYSSMRTYERAFTFFQIIIFAIKNQIRR